MRYGFKALRKLAAAASLAFLSLAFVGSAFMSQAAESDKVLKTLEDAKTIALSDAGLTAEEVTFKEARLGYDDGVKIYEIEFFTKNAEYDYDINAKTGAVVEKDIEYFKVP